MNKWKWAFFSVKRNSHKNYAIKIAMDIWRGKLLKFDLIKHEIVTSNCCAFNWLIRYFVAWFIVVWNEGNYLVVLHSYCEQAVVDELLKFDCFQSKTWRSNDDFFRLTQGLVNVQCWNRTTLNLNKILIFMFNNHQLTSIRNTTKIINLESHSTF